MLVPARDWRFKSSLGHKERKLVHSQGSQLSSFVGIVYNTAVFEKGYFGQLAQLVRASRLHREGRRFESPIAHRSFSVVRRLVSGVDFLYKVWIIERVPVERKAGVAQW